MKAKINLPKALILGLFISLIGLLFYSNVRALIHNCIHATDFSIYQQAIYNMAANWDFNPYLTVRNLNIFNDHFDPIIILAAPWVKLFKYNPISLLAFEYLWFLGLFFFWHFKCEEKYSKEYFLGMFILLFNKAFLVGLEFPIHPTTWAMLPSFTLAYFIYKDNKTAVIINSLILCTFKESFQFGILSLSIWYLIKKDIKTFVPLFIISFLFSIFNFHFRAELLGQTQSYGSSLLAPMLESPFVFLLEKISSLKYKVFLKVLYPWIFTLITAGYFYHKKHRPQFNEILKKPFLGVFFYIAPLFLILILANKFHFQYPAHIIAPLCGILFFGPALKTVLDYKKIAIVTIVLFTASSSGTITKRVKFTYRDKTNKCLLSSKAKASKDKIKSYIATIPHDKTILASGGVIPNSLLPNQKIYQMGYFSKKLNEFDYLILEKHKVGDTFPYDSKLISNILSKCKSSANEVITNNNFVFIAKGIDQNCLREIYKTQAAY